MRKGDEDGSAGSDPEDEVRNRILAQQQVSPDPPAPDPNPVWDTPQDAPAPPAAPAPEQPQPYMAPAPAAQPTFQTETQGITDPGVQAPSAPSPAPAPYPTQGGSASLSTVIAQLYRTALGREASPAEVSQWANGGMDL